MGFDAFPLAAGAAAIDALVGDMRADLVRANMHSLLNLARSKFPGNAMRALSGCGDRTSVALRQVAIYLGHTALSLKEAECAAVFRLHKSQATRAIQTIERMRADPQFNSTIEQLEDAISAVLKGRPVPPTQGLTRAAASESSLLPEGRAAA
jgi:hypothetical protein